MLNETVIYQLDGKFFKFQKDENVGIHVEIWKHTYDIMWNEIM